MYKIELNQRLLKSLEKIPKKDFLRIKEKLYRNGLKNRDYAKEAPQNFGSERATIAEWQGASENRNCEVKPTQAETDSSDFFGIEALKENPRPRWVEKMITRLGFRISIGNYRIIFEIDDKKKIIIILAIDNRKDIYRKS